MYTVKSSMIILVFFVSVLRAQDDDLKKVYTDVTTAINSALLTKSGSMEISGSVSFNYFNTSYNSGETLNQSIFQAEPQFSYFLFDNISLGIDLSYIYQKSEFERSDETTTLKQTALGPFAKMYFGDEKFRPFILADYLFLSGDDFKGGEADFGAEVYLDTPHETQSRTQQDRRFLAP